MSEPAPFENRKRVCHKESDGWEVTEAPHGTIYFFRGGSFDVCVWQATVTEDKPDGKFTVFPEGWQMSCHRQFGFSAHLKAATDARTAKLLALSIIQERCREGAHRAAKAIVETAAAHHEQDKKLPAFRDMPLGKPNHKKKCQQCGAAPIVPLTKLCGPCTFGEPETAGGNW